jgi:hypothetical protein
MVTARSKKSATCSKSASANPLQTNGGREAGD